MLCFIHFFATRISFFPFLLRPSVPMLMDYTYPILPLIRAISLSYWLIIFFKKTLSNPAATCGDSPCSIYLYLVNLLRSLVVVMVAMIRITLASQNISF
jgi:hypothetical protein